MCGLVGIVSLDKVSGKRVGVASEGLKHRGPDGDGYVLFNASAGLVCRHNEPVPEAEIEACAIFAHRRLAILDTSEAPLSPCAKTALR